MLLLDSDCANFMKLCKFEGHFRFTSLCRDLRVALLEPLPYWCRGGAESKAGTLHFAEVECVALGGKALAAVRLCAALHSRYSEVFMV